MKRIAVFGGMLLIVAIALSACQSPDAGSMRGLGSRDEMLAERIQENLQADMVTRNARVGVGVQNGVATIYGREPSMEVLARIRAIVENTRGVIDVEYAF